MSTARDCVERQRVINQSGTAIIASAGLLDLRGLFLFAGADRRGRGYGRFFEKKLRKKLPADKVWVHYGGCTDMVSSASGGA